MGISGSGDKNNWIEHVRSALDRLRIFPGSVLYRPTSSLTLTRDQDTLTTIILVIKYFSYKLTEYFACTQSRPGNIALVEKHSLSLFNFFDL